jgi:protein TonB
MTFRKRSDGRIEGSKHFPIMNAVVVSLTLHALAGWVFLNIAQDMTDHRVVSPVEFFAVPSPTHEDVPPIAPPAVLEPAQNNVIPAYSRQVPPSMPVAATEPVSESPVVSSRIKQQVEATPPPSPDPPIADSPQTEEPPYFRSVPAFETATTAPDASSTPAVSQSATSGNNGTETLTAPGFGAAYLHNLPPAYPFTAKKLKLQGTAVVRVLVSSEGEPKNVELERTSGARILDDAAVETVKRWSFVPARRGNNPITALVNVSIRFQLE